ncbi:MAG TPA: MFS transporter [Terriglobales bacterium]|nr:MFS transporter [Terriglobales bacterium]
MRQILKDRGLRLVFSANLVSMVGSGMNSAAVIWYILQATHSEAALGWLLVLQTLPAMLMMPFSGVIIDREDRRRLVMMLDAGRAAVILLVAGLAFLHRVHVWQLYLMNILVAAGFWMFWPTVTALIQELTPGEQFVQSNTLLLAGVQGGWLLAGAVVGFVYNHIGLGGVLLIDVSSYVVSFLCYLAVRKGKHVVKAPERPEHATMTAVRRYLHEMREGVSFISGNRAVIAIGTAWSLFTAAMMTQGVVTAPLTDRILHAGAVGYGWLNGSWAVGAFMSAFFAPALLQRSAKKWMALSLAILAACLYTLPLSRFLLVACLLYWVMGTGRGVAGVALNTGMMQLVPKHFMGRVQNFFYFFGMLLQIVSASIAGQAAHRIALTWAFVIIGTLYASAFVAAAWPAPQPLRTAEAVASD